MARSGVAFAYDRVARETGACLLLDTLVPRLRWNKFRKDPAGCLREILKKPEGIERELDALVQLVRTDGRETAGRREAARAGDGRADGPGQLPLGASVYLCWYSQLRELIARDATEGSGALAGHVRVCALPNGASRVTGTSAS